MTYSQATGQNCFPFTYGLLQHQHRPYRGGMAHNALLADLLEAHGMTHADLAERMNGAIEELTGRRGNVTDRAVRRYVGGQTRRPQRIHMAALEIVFGCRAQQMGLIPPAGTAQRGDPAHPPTPHDQEDPVLRRTFMSAAAGTALSATAASSATTSSRIITVGTSDVARIRHQLSTLWLQDDVEGGGTAMEERALLIGQRSLHLQQNGSATQRVRARLYALAASSTATAAWAAIDSRRMNVAQRHMESAIHLAGLSGDGQVQHQIWRYTAVLSSQRGRWTDAVAATEAAMTTSVHRSDPLYAAVGHAHLASKLARTGDRARAMRAMERARVAFSRADLDEPRPASIAHFTQGELDGLAGLAMLGCGRPADAEGYLHRCVGALRSDQHRNLGYYLMHVAMAQLNQGDVEQASATAAKVNPPSASPSSGRVPHLLTKFTKQLSLTAPGSRADRYWQARALHA